MLQGSSAHPLPSQHEGKCFCKKELMKRTAQECVTTSLDTAKTFYPCDNKGEKVIKFEEKDVTKYIKHLKQANV